MAKSKKGKWIADAVKDKGGLHRALGIPQGKKIPSGKMSAAMKSRDPHVRKMANLAKTLSGFRKR